MALVGCFVEFSFAGPVATNSAGGTLQIYIGQPYKSETITSGNKTNATAPNPDSPNGANMKQCVVSVTTSADGYVATGPTATVNSGADPRRFLPAGTRVDIAVNPGDAVSYTAA